MRAAVLEVRERVEREVAAERPQSPAQADEFTGKDRRVYEIAFHACASKPLERVASEFGLALSADSFDVSEAYRDSFRGRFEQASFEGCLAGIEDQLARQP